MTVAQVPEQARIADEIADLQSYLNGVPGELRSSGAFAAYEARLQDLSDQLAESQHNEARLSSEIDDLARYLSGLPVDVRDSGAFTSYYARLRELQDRLLSLRLSRIASRYERHLALPPAPAPRRLLSDPKQAEQFSTWIRAAETAHEQSAKRYLHLSTALSALVVVSGAAAGLGVFSTTSLVAAPMGLLAAIFAAVQLAVRPGERSSAEQHLAGRIEMLRIELKTLQQMSPKRSEPPSIESGRLEHALRLLDEAHLE